VTPKVHVGAEFNSIFEITSLLIENKIIWQIVYMLAGVLVFFGFFFGNYVLCVSQRHLAVTAKALKSK